MSKSQRNLDGTQDILLGGNRRRIKTRRGPSIEIVVRGRTIKSGPTGTQLAASRGRLYQHDEKSRSELKNAKLEHNKQLREAGFSPKKTLNIPKNESSR
jgi:hypothetical protein